MSLEANERIGDYEILGELGCGGMGRVYRVRNVLSDRVEAMKVLLPDLSGRQELAARFLREIKMLASLNHPNIAQLRTAVTLDNQLVMIMEYVEGTTLAARIEHGPLAPGDGLNYISQVLSALSYAHQQHVVHRDIKPANMMLTPQGVVKLMDFGIARSEQDHGLTMTGSTLGSLSYMSPEQTLGQPTDARSDLYSVGISLYEMVTGRRPFQGDSDFSIMAAHVKETPKPPVELQPALPPALNQIILMAMAKDPAQRFQTADAFRNALSNVVSNSPAAQSARGGTMLDTPVPADFMHNAPTESRPGISGPVATMLDAKVTPTPAPAMATMLDAKVTPRPSGSLPTMLDARVTPRPSGSLPTMLDAKVTPSGVTPNRATSGAAAPVTRPAGYRGLYMALGAALLLLVLVAAGLYLPKHNKTEAKASTPEPVSAPKTSVSTSKPSPGPTAGSGHVTPPTPAPRPSVPNATDAKASTTRQQRLTASAGKPGPTAQPGTDAGPNTQPAVETMRPAARDALEHEIDQLTARAASVNNSLDIMQEQQHAQGVGLRGDMAAKQASLKTNLAKAQDAFEHGDDPRAKRYADLADGDVTVLEHFLGR